MHALRHYHALLVSWLVVLDGIAILELCGVDAIKSQLHVLNHSIVRFPQTLAKCVTVFPNILFHEAVIMVSNINSKSLLTGAGVPEFSSLPSHSVPSGQHKGITDNNTEIDVFLY